MKERIHPLWPSICVIGALMTTWLGERILAGFDTSRVVMAAVGVGLLVAALVGRGRDVLSAVGEAKAIKRTLLVFTVGVSLALVAYALIPLAFAGEGDANPRIRSVLWGAAGTLMLPSLCALLAIELAVYPVAFIGRYEVRRVERAKWRGAGLGVWIAVLVLANFLSDRHEIKVDLATAGKVAPTPTTAQIVQELTEPVRVTLFFSDANEVLDVVRDYFSRLPKTPKLEVTAVDQALAFKLASETGVAENGNVVVSLGKTHEKIRIGDKMSGARVVLKNFDQNFAKAIIKIARQQAVAYFTTGHGERRTEAAVDDPRPSLSLIKQELIANRYEVKPLGVAEGLASDVPKNAALIFIVGPEKPFLPEEIESLRRAFARGARILIALEPEREGETMEAFLKDLGLRFHKTMLANDQEFVRVTRTESDRIFLYTNRYSTHASVTTMTRNANRLATLFPGTGYIEKLEAIPKEAKAEIVVTALDGTFNDANGNLTFDAATEKRMGYGLAAAVTRTSTVEEGRVFVLADPDILTDKYVRFQGNPYLFGDIVYWLRDVKEPMVATVTEEDVRIVHKRDEDALWFYGSTLGAPCLVALVGFFGVHRRKRQ